MSFDVFAILRACRRSRIKVRVFHSLYTNHELLLVELADIASTSPARAHGALRGDGKEFSVASSLIHLGVVQARETAMGRVFRITPAGRSAWRRIRQRLPRGSLRAERE